MLGHGERLYMSVTITSFNFLTSNEKLRDTHPVMPDVTLTGLVDVY